MVSRGQPWRQFGSSTDVQRADMAGMLCPSYYQAPRELLVGLSCSPPSSIRRPEACWEDYMDLAMAGLRPPGWFPVVLASVCPSPPLREGGSEQGWYGSHHGSLAGAAPLTLYLTSELNWSSSTQQSIQGKETEERRLSSSTIKPGHAVATHLHGFTQICQTLPPGFSQWPCSRSFDLEGGVG